MLWSCDPQGLIYEESLLPSSDKSWAEFLWVLFFALDISPNITLWTYLVLLDQDGRTKSSLELIDHYLLSFDGTHSVAELQAQLNIWTQPCWGLFLGDGFSACFDLFVGATAPLNNYRTRFLWRLVIENITKNPFWKCKTHSLARLIVEHRLSMIRPISMSSACDLCISQLSIYHVTLLE